MSTETTYRKLMETFKADMAAALDQAHSEMYGSMLPFLTDDTEANAIHRACELLHKIVIGEFEFDGKSLEVDGHSFGSIGEFTHSKIVDVIASVAGDAAKDAKIKRLEEQVAELTRQYFS